MSANNGAIARKQTQNKRHGQLESWPKLWSTCSKRRWDRKRINLPAGQRQRPLTKRDRERERWIDRLFLLTLVGTCSKFYILNTVVVVFSQLLYSYWILWILPPLRNDEPVQFSSVRFRWVQVNSDGLSLYGCVWPVSLSLCALTSGQWSSSHEHKHKSTQVNERQLAGQPASQRH